MNPALRNIFQLSLRRTLVLFALFASLAAHCQTYADTTKLYPLKNGAGNELHLKNSTRSKQGAVLANFDTTGQTRFEYRLDTAIAINDSTLRLYLHYPTIYFDCLIKGSAAGIIADPFPGAYEHKVKSFLSAPPGSPNTVDSFGVNPGSTGDFATHANAIAGWNGTSWGYTTPAANDYAYATTTFRTYQYISGVWTLISGTAVKVNGNQVSGASLVIGSVNNKPVDLQVNQNTYMRINTDGSIICYGYAGTGQRFAAWDTNGKLLQLDIDSLKATVSTVLPLNEIGFGTGTAITSNPDLTFDGTRFISNSEYTLGTGNSAIGSSGGTVYIGGFVFGASTFFVDNANNKAAITNSTNTARFGINQANPAYPLDVTGAANFTSDIHATGIATGASSDDLVLWNGTDGFRHLAPGSYSSYILASPVSKQHKIVDVDTVKTTQLNADTIRTIWGDSTSEQYFNQTTGYYTWNLGGRTNLGNPVNLQIGNNQAGGTYGTFKCNFGAADFSHVGNFQVSNLNALTDAAFQGGIYANGNRIYGAGSSASQAGADFIITGTDAGAGALYTSLNGGTMQFRAGISRGPLGVSKHEFYVSKGGAANYTLNTSDLALTINGKGVAEYNGNPSLYFTDSSLVTKKYTDSSIAVSAGGGGLSSTDDLPEGSTNLYWTNTRFDTRFGLKSTTDLTEGTNLYYTSTRFNTAFAAKSTTDLTEGSNLYYTTGRFDTRFTAKSTSDLTEGTNLYYTDARFDTRLALKSTSNLTEGSNLYFTNARAIAATLTAYSSGAGTVASTDNILQAIQKLNGNNALRMLIANNGSDIANAGTFRSNLGATTVGSNIFTAANPSAITFIKVAADNSVSFRTPAQVLADIAAASSGTTVQGHALTANVTIAANEITTGVLPDAQFQYTKGILGSTFAATNTINATSTNFISPMASTGNFNTQEGIRSFTVPTGGNGTARYLIITTASAQPATGSLVITVRKNGADQAITFTIAASAAAGDFTDNTNSFTVAAGDKISIKGVNNASTASAAIVSAGMVITNY